MMMVAMALNYTGADLPNEEGIKFLKYKSASGNTGR